MTKILLFGLVTIALLSSCSKVKDSEKASTAGIPEVTTDAIFLITKTTAKSGGTITDNRTGLGYALASGVCWSTSPNPTVSLPTKTAENKVRGHFISNLTGLTLNTTYYVRAYASNSAGVGYGNQRTFTTPGTYEVGQSYGGGYIFYIDGTGSHGLIAATTDQNKTVDKTSWSNNVNLITNATSLIDGLANTNLIIVVQGNTGNYAAKLSKDYRGGGFNDWFLPSKSQLQTLWSATNAPNVQLTDIVYNLLSSFSSNAYWSSTENNKDSAIIINWGNGGQSEVYSKESKNTYQTPLVRSIRAF